MEGDNLAMKLQVQDRQDTVLQTILKYGFLPISLVFFCYIALSMLDAGIAKPIAFTVSSIGLFISLYFVEKIIPYQEKWLARDGQELNDIGHTFFGTYLGAFLGDTLVTVVVGLYIAGKSPNTDLSTLSLIAQTIGVYLVADLGRYIQHRIHHRVPFLWKFHELHHDVEKMSILKTSRSHIIERILQQIFMFTPVYLIGFHGEAILMFLMINSMWGLYCHSTADLRIGIFEEILMGPGSHRVHHSSCMKLGNTNFGSALVVWDRLFGTYTNPNKLEEKVEVGLGGDHKGPTSIKEQIISPFRFN